MLNTTSFRFGRIGFKDPCKKSSSFEADDSIGGGKLIVSAHNGLWSLAESGEI